MTSPVELALAAGAIPDVEFRHYKQIDEQRSEMIKLHGYFMTAEQIEFLHADIVSRTQTKKVFNPLTAVASKFASQKGDDHAKADSLSKRLISVVQLQVLLHYYTTSEPFVGVQNRAVVDAMTWLINNGMMVSISDRVPWRYELTESGNAWVETILRTPRPVVQPKRIIYDVVIPVNRKLTPSMTAQYFLCGECLEAFKKGMSDEVKSTMIVTQIASSCHHACIGCEAPQLPKMVKR